MSTELKELVRKDLNTIKEKENKKRIEENSKLKTITVYTGIRKGNDIGSNLLKYLDEGGIKYTEKNIEDNLDVKTIVQNQGLPIVSINGEYLVFGRDFQTPIQCEQAVRHFANKNYTTPDPIVALQQQLKNLNHGVMKGFQAMNQQIGLLKQDLKPVIEILKGLEEESKEENAKENK
jgi:glutaredoxin